MAEIVHFRVDTRLTALLGESYRSTEAALKELVVNRHAILTPVRG
jgi:hypothetical protein